MKGNNLKVALVCPTDDHTLEVMRRVQAEGVAEFVCFYGDDASVRAVECVRSGGADVLMKGAVNTDVLLRAALDKEHGILQKGRVMAHIAVAKIPGWERPLIFSDAAVVPHPDVEQMDAIVRYTIAAARNLGIENPKVALTNFTEKENSKFPQTAVYQEIKRRAAEGRYTRTASADAAATVPAVTAAATGGATVPVATAAAAVPAIAPAAVPVASASADAAPVPPVPMLSAPIIAGPMDVKTALDAESGSIKGIASPVVGNADILIFPNIEAGNTFYKTITLFAHATIAGWLAGTEVPVVVTSRADSVESKYYSLITALKMTKR